jgi:hypothetical protein
MLRKGNFTRHTANEDAFSLDDSQRLLGHADVLCVHEYLHVYGARPAETPERRLMAALLREAIECYIRDCHAGNRHKKRSYREAEEWFFGGDDSDVFSLDNVCAFLNLAPGYIRRMLIDHTRQSGVLAEGARSESPGRRQSAEMLLAS